MMERLSELVDVQQLLTTLIEFLPRLIVAVVIFAGFLFLYRVLRPILTRALLATNMAEALVKLLVQSVFRYTLMVLGLVMAADQLGINVTAALAGLGVAGIAVGFAAQDSVTNIISGVIIFLDKPFVVGDWVESPSGDFFGRVSEITLRSTRIRTPRNTFVVIPNKIMVDSVVENLSKHGELRVDVPVGIAYKEDMSEARRVILEALSTIPDVRSDPAPDVVVEGLGDSSVNLLVRVWIDKGSQRQGTTFSVVETSKRALDDAGIEIPFPHLQLFVDEVKEPVWKAAKALGRAES